MKSFKTIIVTVIFFLLLLFLFSNKSFSLVDLSKWKDSLKKKDQKQISLKEKSKRYQVY
ncbi:MAG TPA: hypothetical protein P5048_02845 [Chlamydiales bacterium]|nr:hypothetical protein [Chlamydiales bacterium]